MTSIIENGCTSCRQCGIRDAFSSSISITQSSRQPIDIVVAGAGLFEQAVSIGVPRLSVLGNADMVLHGGLHLFTEDFSSALRQLYDIHLLLAYFADRNGFWEQLVSRAQDHRLGRILFYLLRYSEAVFDTHVPAKTKSAAAAHAPNKILLAMMDRLVVAAILSSNDASNSLNGIIFQWLLFVRSHWLRMPPGLLVRHLLRKAWQNSASGRIGAVRTKPEIKPESNNVTR